MRLTLLPLLLAAAPAAAQVIPVGNPHHGRPLRLPSPAVIVPAISPRINLPSPKSPLPISGGVTLSPRWLSPAAEAAPLPAPAAADESAPAATSGAAALPSLAQAAPVPAKAQPAKPARKPAALDELFDGRREGAVRRSRRVTLPENDLREEIGYGYDD